MSQVKYLTVIAQSLVSKVRSYKMAGWSGFKRLYTLDAHTHTHTYTHAHTHTHFLQAGLMQLYESLFIVAAALGESDLRLSEMLQVCVCVHVFVCVCVLCVCMYMCVQVVVCACICVHVNVCVSGCVCMYMCACICV